MAETELDWRSGELAAERASQIALHHPIVLLVGASPQLIQPRVVRGDRILVFPNRTPDPVREPQAGDDRDEQPEVFHPQGGDDQDHQELHAPSLRRAKDKARRDTAAHGRAHTPAAVPAQIRIYQPDPLLPLEPGQKVEVSRVSVGPPHGHPDDTFTWASGIELEKPDPPKIKFGFRANDDTQIDAAELPRAINLVESIMQRFAALPGP